MNNCPKCQSENLQHTRYCTTCGYDYAPKCAEQVTCPTCKQNYPADTQFCMIDGTRLTKPFQEFKPTYDAPPPNYASLNDPAILDEPVPAFPRRAYPQQVYPKASMT